MTIESEIIDQIRQELDDTGSTRWTADSQILPFVKKAVRRSNALIARHQLPFAFDSENYNITSANYTALDLPDDFLCISGDRALTRRDTGEVLELISWAKSFEDVVGTKDVVSIWQLDLNNSTFHIREAPSADADTIICSLTYLVKSDASALTTASDTPWGGALNDLIIEYGALRLKNVDEMEVGQDVQMWQEFENAILDQHQSNQLIRRKSRGWNARGLNYTRYGVY